MITLATVSLDSIIDYYNSKGLLAYPDLVKTIAPHIHDLNSSIPVDELKKNYSLLMIWPLVEVFNIRKKGIVQNLNNDDKSNLLRLKEKYLALKSHPDSES